MTAIIYPISGGWQWQGSGWLTELGFIDFAGSQLYMVLEDLQHW